MLTGIFPEHLGDISAEALLQNLTNVTHEFSSVDAFRMAFPRGFAVSAQVELPIAQTPEEQAHLLELFQRRLANARTVDEQREAMERPDRKLIGLVLTAK